MTAVACLKDTSPGQHEPRLFANKVDIVDPVIYTKRALSPVGAAVFGVTEKTAVAAHHINLMINVPSSTNDDADAHTVTFDADKTGSQAFQNGESYRHTFTATGTFRYHCSIHPYMVGEVVVANS